MGQLKTGQTNVDDATEMTELAARLTMDTWAR